MRDINYNNKHRTTCIVHTNVYKYIYIHTVYVFVLFCVCLMPLEQNFNHMRRTIEMGQATASHGMVCTLKL